MTRGRSGWRPGTALPFGARVVVVRLSALGDVVQSVGAVRGLAAARPDLELHWVVQREFAPVLEGLPGLAGVVLHERRGGVRGFLSTARRIRALAPRVVLDLQGNWKSSGLARLAMQGAVIGPVGGVRRESTSARLCHCRVPCGSRHPAQVALDLTRFVGGAMRAAAPRLFARRHEIEAEARAVRALGVDPSRPFRVFVVAREADPRAWRHSAWQREFQDRSRALVAVAGPDEHDLRLPDWLPTLRHARGEVRRLIGLGTVAARAGGDCVGPDKGPLHVLAATGLRAYAIHGPTDPSETGAPSAIALGHPSPPSCAPCRRRRCDHLDGPVCTDFTIETAARVAGPGLV